MSTCAEKLEQARNALHKLLTGSAAVSVTYSSANGGSRTVQYARADIDKLRTYIRELEAECGASGSAKPRRPFEVTW